MYRLGDSALQKMASVKRDRPHIALFEDEYAVIALSGTFSCCSSRVLCISTLFPLYLYLSHHFKRLNDCVVGEYEVISMFTEIAI